MVTLIPVAFSRGFKYSLADSTIHSVHPGYDFVKDWCGLNSFESEVSAVIWI